MDKSGAGNINASEQAMDVLRIKIHRVPEEIGNQAIVESMKIGRCRQDGMSNSGGPPMGEAVQLHEDLCDARVDLGMIMS